MGSQRLEAMRLIRASSIHLHSSSGDDDESHSHSSPRHNYESQEQQGSSSERFPIEHDSTQHPNAPLLESSSQHTHRRKSFSSHARDAKVDQRRGTRGAFSAITGLVIHAAADGIAMGASAGSGDEGLKLIVLFAIMIHKAVCPSRRDFHTTDTP